LSSMRSLHISENSVSALTSSLSSRSKPPLKSAALHRPSSLAPYGERPPSWPAAMPPTRANGNRARNKPALKTFSRCGIPTGGATLMLGVSVIPSGGGSFTSR
jgi:hypothetical protein